MPPKRQKKQYSEGSLLQALADVATSKLSIRQAAAKHGVPVSTLGDRASCKYAPEKLKSGRRSKLKAGQEEMLVKYLLYRSAIGNGATRNNVRYIIKDILDNTDNGEQDSAGEDKLFQGNLPSKVWVHRFMNRHPEIVARSPETLGGRKGELSPTICNNWFPNVKNFLLERHGIQAEHFLSSENSNRIFNIGELRFPLSGNELSFVSEKDGKNVSNNNGDREMITAAICVGGDGSFINPLIAFPGYTSLDSFYPSKYDVRVTPNGRLSSSTFLDWFSNSFVQSLKKRGVRFPLLIFMCSQTTHINMKLVDFCRTNDIILFCFPAMTPLESSVLGTLRTFWNESLRSFRGENSTSLTLNYFFPIFGQAFEKAKETDVINAFQSCGIIPFNSNAIDFSTMIEGDRRVTRSEKLVNNNHNLSAITKFGVLVAFKTFTKEISNENIELFEHRFRNNYDVEDTSNLNQLWRAYKTLRELTESNPEGHINKSGELQVSQQPSGDLEEGLSDEIKTESTDELNLSDNSPDGSNVITYEIPVSEVLGITSLEDESSPSNF